MTKEIDSFIGTRHKTPKGGMIIIKGWGGKKSKDNRKLYTWECSICSVDLELFPVSTSTCIKKELNKGRIPCGCSINKNYSEAQRSVIIDRLASQRGKEFRGWNGEYRGSKTLLKLYCPTYNSHWETTCLANYLRRDIPSPIEGKLTRKNGKFVEDETYIRRFNNSGSYPKGTIFTRQGVTDIWDIACSVCSKDKYVQEAICSGIFTATTGDIAKGILSCRCSLHPYKTKEVVEFDIVSALSGKKGGTFIGWNTTYQNRESKFDWICSKNHQCTTRASSFLKSGSRCVTCFEESNPFGFNTKRADETDYLYVIELSNEDETFVKIGRSFNVANRMKDYKRHYDVNLIFFVPSTHRLVWYAEQELHSIFNYFHYTPIIKFGGSVYECFDPVILNVLDDTILDYL